MNTLVIVLIAAVCLFGAYALYGRWLANKWGIDPFAKTPAVTHEDGRDYVPTNGWTVFAHQFSSIAGAGPVTGAIQAAAFGWLPVLLWVLLGGIFFGAVTDFGALYASVKNDGKSMGMLIEKYIGKTGRKLFLLFCWLFCGIVIAAFADMVAGTFNAYAVVDGVTQLSEAAKTNGAAGMVSIMFMVFAVVFGLIQNKAHLTGWKENVLSILFIVLSFVIGANFPITLGKAGWSYITFVYIFFAAVLPMWLLKQPRDHMTTFMFVAMIIGAVLGLVVAHPTMNLPVYTGFTNAKLGTMFPILFVTVACGAVSGFHSLVSSGTSSKTVSNEKDMLKVGYGAMILESLLAVIALCVAGAAAAADGTPAAGTPFQIFSRGVAGFFEMFGVPAYAATVFMTMCVSALALTSLDAVARIGRMSFQELFSVDDMDHAEGWRKLLCNVYFSTFVTLAFGFLLTKIGYANIWPLFGSANQLLSALVLATLCVFLKVTGRSNKMLFPPLVIMLCVTFTALVQRLIAMVKAISTAASVSIPAGETTWGAVFIANGLQLILAVLLIVLGLNIVFHSFKAYKNAEHNSEAKV
ncbi:MAG: carbon starvation CstA family protein [Faecalibacterium prausnitzii]|nr:carbon starvation CstA family protein [Faecalibacterium prausnitzii]MDY2682606.1 carbon starvation CstA family protein [Faecalibacterium prausnitzii]